MWFKTPKINRISCLSRSLSFLLPRTLSLSLSLRSCCLSVYSIRLIHVSDCLSLPIVLCIKKKIHSSILGRMISSASQCGTRVCRTIDNTLIGITKENKLICDFYLIGKFCVCVFISSSWFFLFHFISILARIYGRAIQYTVHWLHTQ